MLYGGLPQILTYKNEEQKVRLLKSLFDETYIKDIKDRYNIKKDDDLEELVNIIASGIGALTNPNKLANTFNSIKKSPISYDTIKDYIEYLCDSFLIEKATRYDIKGKKYISTPFNISGRIDFRRKRMMERTNRTFRSCRNYVMMSLFLQSAMQVIMNWTII